MSRNPMVMDVPDAGLVNTQQHQEMELMNTNHATTSRKAAILEAPRVVVRIAVFAAVVVGLTLVGSSAAFAETPENDLPTRS